MKYLCRRFLAACKLRAVPPIVSIRTPELRRRRIIPAPLCRIFVSSASTYGASIREFVTTSEATCIADEALFRFPFMLMQMHAILFGSSTSFERRIRSIKTCQMLLLQQEYRRYIYYLILLTRFYKRSFCLKIVVKNCLRKIFKRLVCNENIFTRFV